MQYNVLCLILYIWLLLRAALRKIIFIWLCDETTWSLDYLLLHTIIQISLYSWSNWEAKWAKWDEKNEILLRRGSGVDSGPIAVCTKSLGHEVASKVIRKNCVVFLCITSCFTSFDDVDGLRTADLNWLLRSLSNIIKTKERNAQFLLTC